jgi:uncharacterized protein (TIGR02246 family)
VKILGFANDRFRPNADIRAGTARLYDGPTSLTGGTDMEAVPLSEMRIAAEQLARLFTESWNSQDGHAYGEAYWPDAELVDPTGQVWDGRDAIAGMHIQLWNGPARTTKVLAAVRRVRPIGTEAMVVDLDVEVAGFVPAPPGAAVHAAGKVKAHLKHVVEKRAGDWKIAASQNTFVAAAPPA